MQGLETEVLIIGSGLAGLRAAVESARNGARAIILSKSPVCGASNTALASGGIAAPEKTPVSGLGEVVSGKELENARVVLKAILTSSLERKESRGGLQRQDYPNEGGVEITNRTSVKKRGHNKSFEVGWEQA